MITIATVLKTRTAYLAAAKTLDDTKERLWDRHYGDIAPDDDGDYSERQPAYQADVDAADLGALVKRRNDLREEMVAAFLNATDHPREMRLFMPKLRIADKMGGKVREDLIKLITTASPANLRGGR